MNHARIRRFLEFAVTASLLVAAAHDASADEITIRASHDATIYEEGGDRSNGAGMSLFVGKNLKGRRRALVTFDIAAALPPSTKILDAKLRLFLTRTRSAAADLALLPLTRSWTEGSAKGLANEGGGAPGAPGDVTWTHRSWDTTMWSTPGGDFDATASATASVASDFVAYEWTGSRLVGDVQRWLDQPASNYGWILTGEQVGPKRFASKNGSPATAPALVIAYERPAQPAGACCRSDGTCSITLDPGSNCDGTYQGASTVCTPAPCPPPVGACCRPDATATCTAATETACAGSAGTWLGPGSECTASSCPVVLTHFVDALPLPAAAAPHEGDGGVAHYRMAIQETRQKLHRDLPPTTVWGFDDGKHGPSYPGPTIHAQRGRPLKVTWVNDLRDAGGAFRKTHYLPVDRCLHGAETDAPRTVIHLHGGHVPSAFDGQPELTLLPGEETAYEYPNNQPAATLWYHDHSLGITRLNVVMGLAGYYILEDEAERPALPSGKYDVPLAIQDRSFNPDGSFRYPAAFEPHAFGNSVLVNGKVWPFLEVDRGSYRFRLLNGSTSRTFALALSSHEAFLQVGTDGGLLSHPIATQTLTLAPGERAEIVVDFSKHLAGDEVILKNSAPAPYPSGMEENRIDDVMKFVVTAHAGFTDAVPLDLRSIAPPDERTAVTSRDFVLKLESEGCGGSMWMINGKHWGDITERPHLGTSEIWRFINRSGFMHPMHMHLVMFQVLDHQRFHLSGEEIVPDGSRTPAPSSEGGLKDTIQVPPFEMVRVIARFEDYAGKFPYHCHILEHEDNEMMRQFETSAVCGDRALARNFEECDDGNTTSGDGCSADCKLEVDSGITDAGGTDSSAPDGAASMPERDAGPADAAHPAEAGPRRPSERTRSDCGCRVPGGRRSRHSPIAVLVIALCMLAHRRARREGNR